MGHIYVLGRVENHCTFTSDIYKLWEAIGDIPSQRYSLAAVSQPDNRIGIVGGENDRRKYSNMYELARVTCCRKDNLLQNNCSYNS